MQPAAVSALSRRFRAETPYIVNFSFDADRLDAEAMARLDQQAEWIIDHPHVKFRVYGHTDKVGSNGYNDDLAMRRAMRVVGYLVSKGIDESRLEAVVSYGEDAPLVDTEAQERMNRRVLTDVIGYFEPVEVQEHGDPLAPALVSKLIVDLIPPSESGTDGGQVPPAGQDPTDQGGGGEGTGDQGGGDQGNGNGNGGQNTNAGRGNGDEGGDPGNSGGHNQGGDETT